MLDAQLITTAILSHWADQLPLDVTTVYPDTRVDTSELSEWFELTIDRWADLPHRHNALRLVELSITVHCFVRPGTDKARIHELTSAARSTLARQTIPIREPDSGAEVLGYLTTYEPDTRILTRHENDTLRHPLQHQTLTTKAQAQQS